jgi:transcriptional regulator with XRE-family HTH domain
MKNEMVYMPGLELVRDDFKTALEFRRQTKRYTQKKLAELSGVNIRMIQYYEQGVKDINKAQVITVYRLAQALGCTVEDLIEIKKEVEE